MPPKARKTCNCQIIGDGNSPAQIDYCPLHAVAPELLKMLKTVHREGASMHYEAIRELIFHAQGNEENK